MKVATHSCEVIEHTWVNKRYKYMRLRCPAPLARQTVAGQFFQLACPLTPTEHPFLRRPMSVYGIGPEDERIEFLYHVKGVGTRALEALQPGERLSIIGPLGRGFSFSPAWRRVLLVARGVGLATMAPLVPLAARAGVAITAVLSARAPGDLMRAEFLRGAAADVHAVFDSDGSSGVERVEALLARLLAGERPDMIYTCGSNRLLALLQKLGAQGEVALEQQMACAMGVCLSCVRLFNEGGAKVFRRVCCEGPVFPLEAVAGEVQFG
ncbi:MAG TPA: dihydroorotate dehydrogenase electron transfer subunit [Burkholderiales bacterium]|nr:dihydroorotate dehydrogenase electron transfer subunit [Burkholderiales bacterium]